MNLILSGLGINLKTTITDLLKSDYHVVPNLKTLHKTETLNLGLPFDSRSVLLNQYLCHSMYKDLKINKLFDRSLSDNLVINKIITMGITDISPGHYGFDFDEMINHFKKLNENLYDGDKTIRILLSTHNIELLESVILGENHKNTMRIDFYTSVSDYLKKQQIFNDLYKDLHPEVIEISIEDELSIEDNIINVISKINFINSKL